MKILIVTSQITYVPNNCQDFLSELLKKNPKNLAGLVILQNLSLDIITKILWLYGMGCRNLATALLKNWLELPLGKREKLFKKHNLPVFKLKTTNDPSIIEWVRKNNIDLVINLRTRCIYREQILNAPRLGCINIHHGILPKYRGIFSDLYALFENRPAGITVHRMSEKIDDGQVLFTKQISHTLEKDYIDYLSRTGHEEATLTTKLLEYIEQSGRLPNGITNKVNQPVYTSTPSKYDIRKMQKGGMIL